MKFKVGDEVKCTYSVKSQFTEGCLYTIEDISSDGSILRMYDDEGYYNGMSASNFELVTNDYITTKDFIKEVEKLGYEVDKQDYGIIIKLIEGRSLVVVRLYELMQIDTITYNFDSYGVLFDLVVKYAKTPIEFREEPKKYTLELPNTTIKARYFRFGLPHATHSYKFGALPKSTTNGDIDYQAYFTQQEIDNLPNQELIKCLIEKEVKND